MNKIKKIVLTGAPSSGKSSALAAIEALNLPHLALVPESAVVLLKGGFPAPAHDDLEQVRFFQNSILTVQENLELICTRRNPKATHMILDRAKLDGAAFWPPGIEDYLKNFPVKVDEELAKYDHVLFLEMPKKEFFGGVHQSRFHNFEQSLESQRRLEIVWGGHPSFTRIDAHADFSIKIQSIMDTLKKLNAL
ncbi:ATP-binding protein [Bdellovibrio sp. SKB1291214]|uniref:AAA family ATPase n=1 Tax=Bdellovibrio sp. SKB1291214 TaxID=1732569 RepID=UPI000B517F81|nr:AAA family ATPase [Bdellovibrio sp. SKB1291214]UYL10351.1 ATP-binding protein [Bdellovibrio sp. SKB1291214]